MTCSDGSEMVAGWVRLLITITTHLGLSHLLPGQVLALRLRSTAASGAPLPAAAAEIDYPTVINRALPDSIRVLGWADVDQEFNARWANQHKLTVVVSAALEHGGRRPQEG
jgi:hypothetical protein